MQPYCDPDGSRHLLTNAMESGGHTVRIRVAVGADWRRHRRSGIRVTIADDGRGIPRPACQLLFHPFFTTKSHKGAGLGLWASRAIVLRNDGNIRIRTSTAGLRSGTCVRVFLPTVVEPRAFNVSLKQAVRTAS